MKVCYFIQTHKNPEQIYRLVRTIKKSSPKAQILIGHDFTSCHLDMTPIQDLSDVELLRGHFPVLRGHISILQPYFNAIDWLFKHNSDFDWLIYLSGQDYPTQSLSEVEDFLFQTEYDGFIRYWDVFSELSPWNKEEAYSRYFCHYYRLSEKLGKWLYERRGKIGKFIPIEFFPLGYGWLLKLAAPINCPFNEQFICYGGWAWFTLSRKCIQYLMKFIKDNPKLINYYKRTVLPEESIFQTILVNSKLFKFCNDDKRFVDFARGSGYGHPWIITTEDYSTITNGNFHFARKFEQDSEILDMLDRIIS